MPLYDFKCKKCGIVSEHFFHMNDEKVVDCCGEVATRLFYPPYFSVDNVAGHYSAFGGYVKNRSELKSLEKQHNVRPAEDGVDKPVYKSYEAVEESAHRHYNRLENGAPA